MIAQRNLGSVLVKVSLALALSIAVASPAFAQRGGGGGGNSDGGGAPSNIELGRLELLAQSFKLDKDQKKAVKTMIDDAHKGAEPIRQALTTTHAAIGVAIQAGKPQAEIDAAAKAYAVQATAMTQLEMKTLGQVINSLSKDQRANAAAISSAFFMFRGMFLDPKKWDVIPDSTRAY